MKKILELFAATMFISIITLGQVHHSNLLRQGLAINSGSKQVNLCKKVVNKILQKQENITKYASPLARTTSTSERLKSSSIYDMSDTLTWPLYLTDSAYYAYNLDTGGRGSIFDLNQMSYGNDWSINSNTIYGYGTNVGNFINNRFPGVYSDTTMIWNSFNSTGTFDFFDTRYSVFDTNENVTDYADLYAQIPTATYAQDRDLNTYDANGKILNSIILSWDSTNWDTSAYRQYTYDTNGNIVKDSISIRDTANVWHPYGKWYYFYNTAGNLDHAYLSSLDTFGNWDTSNKYILDYYTGGSFRDITMFNYDSLGNPLPGWKDSVGYSTGISYTTYDKESYYYLDGSLYYTTIKTKHITSGLPDTVFINYYDENNTFIFGGKISYTYDAYYQPSIANAYSLNVDSSGSWYDTIPDGIFHYYYELFEPSTNWYRKTHNLAISNASNPNNDIQLFPNPASNEINIRQSNITKGSAVQVLVINTLGQTVKSELIQQTKSTESISISNLSPGIYWLNVVSNEGIVLGTKEFVKQ